MAKSIKQLIRRDIETIGAEWIDKQPVLLGDYSATVQTSTPGMFYARQYNGKVIEVYNAANVPPTFDLHVIVGRKKSLPTIWQIIEIRETYGTPAAFGQIGYHHHQHEFPGGDTVWADRKQIVPLTCLVYDAAGFIVLVLGSVVHTATGIRKIENQFVDLSSYVVTAGATFVSIETDDEGVLSVHAGVAFGAPAVATDADIPVPDPGKYLIAFVLLYEGQTELSNEDIRVPFPLGVVQKNAALQIHDSLEVKYLHERDEIGLWETAQGLMRKIKWASVKNLLRAYFNKFYATVSHTHPEIETGGEPVEAVVVFNDGEGDPAAIGTAADGTSSYPARRDHVHELTRGSAVLGSSFSITGAAGTYQDTGLSITLPSEGTYKITANVRAALVGNAGTLWWIHAKLYNSTDSADVTDSERMIVLTGTTGLHLQNTAPIDPPFLTVAASKTIKLYAARNGSGSPSWSLSDIATDANGRTTLMYEKIG